MNALYIDKSQNLIDTVHKIKHDYGQVHLADVWQELNGPIQHWAHDFSEMLTEPVYLMDMDTDMFLVSVVNHGLLMAIVDSDDLSDEELCQPRISRNLTLALDTAGNMFVDSYHGVGLDDDEHIRQMMLYAFAFLHVVGIINE